MKIDIEKSISNKKLIFRRTFFQKINYYLFNIIYFVFLLPVLSLYIIIYGNSINEKGVIFLILLNIPFIWNIIGLKFINELTYIGNANNNLKSKYISQIKNDCKYEITIDEENLVIMNKNNFWLKSKQLIIIFHKEKVYANLTYLGRGNIRIPFFSYTNRKKLLMYRNRSQKEFNASQD